LLILLRIIMHRVSVLLLAAIVAAAICPFKTGNVENGKKGDCPFSSTQFQPDPEITANGCTCKTNCGAGFQDLFNCDWCYTKDGCNKGKDFCVYPADKEYESQRADAKLDFLWSNIAADNTPGPPPNPVVAFTESVQTSFDRFSDFMPRGRVKVIHGQGAVCKFKMEMNSSSPYTGVLKKGNVARGLIRMGSALPVDAKSKSGVVPGLGIKFMRSNVPSANFVALYSLSALPDNDYNFMAKTLSNHLPPAQGIGANALAKKFTQKSGCPTMVGLSDICKYDIDGSLTPAAKLVFPFELRLDSKEKQFPSTPIDGNQLLKQLSSIPANTNLFEVSAFFDPKHAQSGEPAAILGTMVTDGPCVLSKFGDENLFFKHQLVEEDWQLQRTWIPFLKPMRDCSSFKSEISVEPPKGQCKTKSSASVLKSEEM